MALAGGIVVLLAAHATMPPHVRGMYVPGQKPLDADGRPLPEPVFYNAAPVDTRPTAYKLTDRPGWKLQYWWQPPKRKRARKVHDEIYESKAVAESWRDPLMHFLNGPRRKGPKLQGYRRKSAPTPLSLYKKQKTSSSTKEKQQATAHARVVQLRANKYRKRMKQCEIQIEYITDRLNRGSAIELVCPMNGGEAMVTAEKGMTTVVPEEEDESDMEENEAKVGGREAPMSNIEVVGEEEDETGPSPQWSEKDIMRATLQANAVKVVYHYMHADLLDAIETGRKRAPVRDIMEKAAALTTRKVDTVYL